MLVDENLDFRHAGAGEVQHRKLQQRSLDRFESAHQYREGPLLSRLCAHVLDVRPMCACGDGEWNVRSFLTSRNNSGH